MKPTTDFSHFDALDIRVGCIVKVEDAQTKKAAYRMTIDFGPEIGTKVSCGAYRNYAKDALVGQQVLAIVNPAAPDGTGSLRGPDPRCARTAGRNHLRHAAAGRRSRRCAVLASREMLQADRQRISVTGSPLAA